ncbi:MAG TPA: phage holin family protein [Caulobacteraceae bacterium]|nr:phage holin family protein [Caulobacteraceae bacterium]
MMGFIVRFLMVVFALWLAAQIVPGIEVRSTSSVVAAAVILGLLNAIVRPILILLTLPLTIVTLGLFLLVINAAMLWGASLFLHGFVVKGFVAALLGSILVSAISWVGQRVTAK